VARGLAYAHQEGFVHADLKPGNVFVTSSSTVKILDFGIAQAVRLPAGAAHDPADDFNAYSVCAITPSYASPEMLRDESPAPADDVFALACLAYELLTGRHPFLDEAGRKLPADKAQAHRLCPAVIKGLSRRHMRALRRGLEFERAQRFRNAGEFIDAIKPRSQVRRSLLWLIASLALFAGIAWWQLAARSDAAIDLNDLPSSMASTVESIRLGDRVLDRGDIDQAQNLFAHAWESAQSVRENQPRDVYKLKVILDRRFDRIADALLAQAARPDLDEFRLLQLQIALEFLRKDSLGQRDVQISQALARIAERLATHSPP
jgi:serine/threonine protein kinase